MSRNLVIRGPPDINGNKRVFHIFATSDVLLRAQKEPIEGGGILAIVFVDAAEYRRLAKLFDIPLNAEDAEATE